MPNLNQLIQALRQGGLKVTPQRHLLCSVIADIHHDHPTVETLHQRAARQMPTLSLKTVYSTLTELAALGVVRLATLGTNSLRVDANPDPHAHLVCRSCGEVLDQPIASPPPLSPSRANALGFDVEEQEIIFRGRCARCRAT